jgi:Zn-dependent protease with chaperone function
MTDVLPDDQRLIDISPKAYEHPADRAATAALAQIPMLDTVVRKLIEFGYERALRQVFLAGSVKLGSEQMPETWAAHRAACARLDLEAVPDLYLTQFPVTNAAAIGSGRPMVMLNSGTVTVMDQEELRTVLGHEVGHILSDHVMYRTALMILLSIGTRGLPVMAGLPLLAVRLILLEWFRAAELSADRAATLVNRDPLVTSRTLMVMAGGAASRKLNLDAFLRQAAEYEEWEPGWDKVSRMRLEIAQTHAFPVRRVSQLMKWVRSGEYDRVMNGEYKKRSDPVEPRAEAGDAVDHYVERFRELIREASAGARRRLDRVVRAEDVARVDPRLHAREPAMRDLVVERAGVDGVLLEVEVAGAGVPRRHGRLEPGQRRLQAGDHLGRGGEAGAEQQVGGVEPGQRAVARAGHAERPAQVADLGEQKTRPRARPGGGDEGVDRLRRQVAEQAVLGQGRDRLLGVVVQA